jgi:hypothetical protein
MSKNVAKNTMYLNIKAAVTTIVSLFTTRIVLNALGASDLGFMNCVWLYCNACDAQFCTNCVYTAFYEFCIRKNDEHEQNKYSITVWCCILD